VLKNRTVSSRPGSGERAAICARLAERGWADHGQVAAPRADRTGRNLPIGGKYSGGVAGTFGSRWRVVTMSSDLARLEARIEKLERENQRLKLLGVLAAALLGALVWMGVSLGENVVNADAYTLTGPKGEPRAMLAMAPDEPTLMLYDNEGRVRMWLGMLDNAPGLVFFDENGENVWKAPPAPPER
jgi:hypothetical protein